MLLGFLKGVIWKGNKIRRAEGCPPLRLRELSISKIILNSILFLSYYPQITIRKLTLTAKALI